MARAILLGILYSALFLAVTLAVFVLGGPAMHRAGLRTAVDVAFPIALP